MNIKQCAKYIGRYMCFVRRFIRAERDFIYVASCLLVSCICHNVSLRHTYLNNTIAVMRHIIVYVILDVISLA